MTKNKETSHGLVGYHHVHWRFDNLITANWTNTITLHCSLILPCWCLLITQVNVVFTDTAASLLYFLKFSFSCRSGWI